MKRSLLTVCSLLLAVGLAGCAVDERGDDGLPLGESRQDLALDSAATNGAGTQDQTAAPPERPEPEPWVSPTITNNGTVVPGPGPAPDSDPRRFNGEAVKAASGGERPEPEPWGPKDTSVSLNKNQ